MRRSCRCASTRSSGDAAQGHALDAHEAAPGPGRAPHDPRRPRDPEEVVEHVGFTAQFDTRDTERALKGSGIEVPPLDSYADKLWDYWERQLDPDLFKDRSFEAIINGKTVLITGASSGIGRATAVKVAAAGGIPLLVARGVEKLEELKAEIESRGGTAHVYPTDLTDMDALEELRDRVLADHPAVDMIVNNAGRSIRRSVSLSHDRFHDFERTMQLNYFSAIKLVMAFLPHFEERAPGTSSTSARSACRPTRRGSAPTSPRRRRSTRGRGSSAPRSSATA